MGELHPKEATPRRKFDSDFKSDAVKLVEIGNRSIKQVANELGISEATLNNWVYNARRAKNYFLTTRDTVLPNSKENGSRGGRLPIN